MAHKSLKWPCPPDASLVCFCPQQQSMGMNQGHNQGMGGPNITSLVGGQTAGGMGPGSSPGMTPGMPNAQMVTYPHLCNYLASCERRFLSQFRQRCFAVTCCGGFRLGLSRRNFHVIGAIYLTRFSHTDNIDLIK